MLDSNLTDVADALRVKQAKFDSKAVKSVRSRVTTINTTPATPMLWRTSSRRCGRAPWPVEHWSPIL